MRGSILFIPLKNDFILAFLFWRSFILGLNFADNMLFPNKKEKRLHIKNQVLLYTQNNIVCGSFQSPAPKSPLVPLINSHESYLPTDCIDHLFRLIGNSGIV